MTEKEDKISEGFSVLKSDLEQWGEMVDDLLVNQVLKDLDDEYKIKIKPHFRVKDVKSYLSKALWRGKKYQNPTIDIEDKVGTRVVFLLSADVKYGADLILKSDLWNAKVTKEYDEIAQNEPEKFGYQSIHIVVWPKDSEKFTNEKEALTCEVQLRTLLQHAYSEISHDSTYKGPFKNDKEIIRKLSKSMALMEATDDYFCSIFNMITDDSRKVRNFTNEIIKIYQTIEPSFDKKNLDKELTEIFFNFLDDFDISEQNIEETYRKNKVLIENAIKKPFNYLPTQPVFLLVVHLFFSHRYELEENWPLKSNLLDELYTTLGVSRL